MSNSIPESLGVIAGRGRYPLLLAESAKKQGVHRLFAVAFKGETDRLIESLADDVIWLRVGQLAKMLDAFRQSGIRDAVMAGQIRPSNLFRVRMDKAMIALLAELKERNAHTIFDAIGKKLKEVGIVLRPASLFMESAMPDAGVLSDRQPTKREREDIALGLKVAKRTSGIEIGQTVVVKEGTILAVEAFEGTDDTIARAGRLGGAGAVVVKVAKQGHDMRFDIPVIGERTLKMLRKARAAVLAIEAGRSIILDREKIIDRVNRQGISLVAVEVDGAGG